MSSRMVPIVILLLLLEHSAAFLNNTVESLDHLSPTLKSTDIICRCTLNECKANEITTFMGKSFKGYCRLSQPGYCRQYEQPSKDGKVIVQDCMSAETVRVNGKQKENENFVEFQCLSRKDYEVITCCNDGHLCNYNTTVEIDKPEGQLSGSPIDKPEGQLSGSPTLIKLFEWNWYILAIPIIIGVALLFSIFILCSNNNNRFVRKLGWLSPLATVMRHPTSSKKSSEREKMLRRPSILKNKKEKESSEEDSGIPKSQADSVDGGLDGGLDLEASARKISESLQKKAPEDECEKRRSNVDIESSGCGRSLTERETATISSGSGPSFSDTNATTQTDSSGGSNLTTLDTGSDSGRGCPRLFCKTLARCVTLGEKIGEGRFGAVYKATWRGETYAVKLSLSRDATSFKRELDIYETAMMRTRNILRYVAADTKDSGVCTELWLMTEYHKHGSVYDYIKRNELDPPTLLSMLRDIADAIGFIHSPVVALSAKPCIAHRDLKTKNLLVRSDLSIVLADFGLSVRLVHNKLDVPQNLQSGTIRYQAPEVLSGDPKPLTFEDFKNADLYALGLIIWEMTRRTNFEHCRAAPVENAVPYFNITPKNPSIRDMCEVVCKEGKRPYFPQDWLISKSITAKLALLMEESWHPKPIARPPAMNIKARIERIAQEHNISFLDRSQ